MFKASPIRSLEDRDSLLASIGLTATEQECLIAVTEEKTLHAFLLFVFGPDGGRITRVITFPSASRVAIDLGLRAVVNMLDRAGQTRALFDPPTEELAAIARSIGFVPVPDKLTELTLDIEAFFKSPCQGH